MALEDLFFSLHAIFCGRNDCWWANTLTLVERTPAAKIKREIPRRTTRETKKGFPKT